MSAQETGPTGLAFKSDGTKLYVVGSTGDAVYQYSLSSAWDVSTASYDSVSFSVSAQEATPTDLAFNSDGTKLYVIGSSGDDINQYTLSSAWDISTATFDSVTFSVAGQDSIPTGLAFKSDGTKLYVIGDIGDDINQYSLSSAWDISTASYDSVTFSVSAQELLPQGLAFKSDGTKLYIIGSNGDAIYQYSLSDSDSTPPTLQTLSPTDDATDVAVDSNLVLTFDEAVQGGTGSIILRKSSDDSIVETFTTTGGLVSGSGSTTITINPSSLLDNSTAYYVVVEPNAFRDASDNDYVGISDDSTWNFTTVAAAAASSSGNSGTSGTSETSPSRGGGRGSSLGMAKRVAAAHTQILARYQGQMEASRVIANADPPTQEHSASPTTPRTDVPQEDSSLLRIAERRGVLLAMAGDVPVLYRDVRVDAWYAPYVSVLIEEEIAQGYKDDDGNLTGEFGVANPVTKAEVLKMAMEAAQRPPDGKPPRNQSARGTWALPYVAWAEAHHITIFTPDIDVHAPATRAEVVRIILEVSGIPTGAKAPAPFDDVPPSHPHGPAIAVAALYGLIAGDTDADGHPRNTFRPDEPINRAEVSKIIALVRDVVRPE